MIAEVIEAPTRFPFTTIDDVPTIDKDERCHVLRECPTVRAKAEAFCGTEVDPDAECYVGCSRCIIGHEAIEVCQECGRLVCDGCRDKLNSE